MEVHIINTSKGNYLYKIIYAYTWHLYLYLTCAKLIPHTCFFAHKFAPLAFLEILQSFMNHLQDRQTESLKLKFKNDFNKTY